MRLIITEKPSVARDIARVLGAKSKHQGYIEGKNVRISWCFGHMAQLAEPAAYKAEWKKWRADELPMIPDSFKLVGRSGARDQIKVLKTQLNSTDITEVVNASWDDLEEESHISRTLNLWSQGHHRPTVGSSMRDVLETIRLDSLPSEF